jgi:hypothetical protein
MLTGRKKRHREAGQACRMNSAIRLAVESC